MALLKMSPAAVSATCLAVIAVSVALAAPARKTGAHPARPPASKAQKPAEKKVELSAVYNDYLKGIRPRIAEHWDFPEGRNKVTLEVILAPDGSASDLKVTSQPPSPDAETAASMAFTQAQPLPALPANSPNAKLTLIFESVYDPHGDSDSKITSRMDPVGTIALPAAQPSPPGSSDNSPGTAPDSFSSSPATESGGDPGSSPSAPTN